MLSWLSDIWDAIVELPYTLINLLIDAINAIIVALAAIAEAILSVLPGFPEAPGDPGGIMGAFLWFFPLGSVLTFFSLMVGLWITWLGVKTVLNWAKVL